ncbi:hypothetical protein BES34_017075 [Leptospira inadai serovar Lyme]|nr:hypothetical protein BES34_017075 [Leptospira inadai serovar Lyme]
MSKYSIANSSKYSTILRFLLRFGGLQIGHDVKFGRSQDKFETALFRTAWTEIRRKAKDESVGSIILLPETSPAFEFVSNEPK